MTACRLLSGTETEEDDEIILTETFDTVQGTGWTSGTSDVPGEDRDNRVAVCAGTCSLTIPVDLTGYTGASLSFHRFLSDDLLTGSHLTVAVKENRTYKNIDSWDRQDGDGVWHHTPSPSTTTSGKRSLSGSPRRRSPPWTSPPCSGTEVTVRTALDNLEVRGTPTAGLVIQDVSVNKDTVKSGDTVKVRWTVRNSGTDTVRNVNVSIYRHDRKRTPRRREAGR